MTNFEWLRTLDIKQTAVVLGFFADHLNHCSQVPDNDPYGGISECTGCPIAVDNCCGWPDDDCNTSVLRWLRSEHEERIQWFDEVTLLLLGEEDKNV